MKVQFCKKKIDFLSILSKVIGLLSFHFVAIVISSDENVWATVEGDYMYYHRNLIQVQFVQKNVPTLVEQKQMCWTLVHVFSSKKFTRARIHVLLVSTMRINAKRHESRRIVRKRDATDESRQMEQNDTISAAQRSQAAII